VGIKVKVLPEIKLRVVEEYLAGKRSVKQIAYQLHVSCYSVEEWIRKYKAFGSEKLITKAKNKFYSSEIKIQAVTDYINKEGSLYDICIRYDISSHGVLQNWIRKYNGHKTLKSHNIKGAIIMTNGRNTTYEEKVEIVAFCIANSNDYILTSNKYKVSYQQVYGWVKKYKSKGHDALVDRRGKHRTLQELTESEKYIAQLTLLESEIKRLKMENDFLKKLEEMERR